MRRKFLAWLSTLLVLIGVLLPAMPAAAIPGGSWSVTSNGPTYSGGNTNWTYTLQSIGTPPILSHMDLALCDNFTTISASPNYSSRGPDASLGLPNVLKWENDRVHNGSVITVTYSGLWATGSQTWYAKAGPGYTGSFSGPSCLNAMADFTISKSVSAQNDPSTAHSSLTLNGGGTAYYFYTIVNNGSLPLTLDSTTDDILGTLSFTPTTIAPNGRATAKTSKIFPVLTPGALPQNETNTVTVRAKYGSTLVGPKTAQATVTNQAPAAHGDFTVSKRVGITPDPAAAQSSITMQGGGTAYYFYTVTNTGNVPIALFGTDDKLGSLTFSPSSIPGGATATATATKNFPALLPGSPDQTETNVVSVMGYPFGTKTAQATVTNQAPVINRAFRVTKSVNTTNNAATAVASISLHNGGVAYYFYTVTNTGNVPLTMNGSDDKLGSLTFSPNPVPVGGVATATMSKTFGTLSKGGSNQVETNVASVFGAYDGTTVGPNTAQAVVINEAPEAHPTFTLTKKVSTVNNPLSGQSSATLYGGGTVYYFYALTNTGDVPLHVSSATDDKLGTLTFTPSTLLPGETATATKTKTFSVPNLTETETNIASVVMAVNADLLPAKQATATVINNPPPSFTVSKRVSTTNDPSTGQASVSLATGGTVYYFYTITNTSPVTVSVETATDDKLGSLSFSPGTILPGGNATATAAKTFPALPAGDQNQVEVNTFSAAIKYNDHIYGPQSASATVTNIAPTARPDFRLTKKVGTSQDPGAALGSVTLTQGGTVFYFYTITNTGNVPLILTGAIDDKLGPPTFSPTTIPVGGTATATASKTFIAPAPNESPIIEVNVATVFGTFRSTTISRSANAFVTNNPMPVQANFSLTKAVSTVNNAATGASSITLPQGGAVYYFYTLTNTGNVPLLITNPTDDMLGALTFSPSTVPVGGTATATASKTFPALAAGGKDQLETNTVTVSATFWQTTAGPKTAAATVLNQSPRSAPSFAVTKTVSKENNAATGQPSVTLEGGGTVYYFYTVTNTGNVSLAIGSAIDDKLGPIAFTPSTIPPGGTATGSATKTFGARTPGSGSETELNTISITATYRGDQIGTQTAQAAVTNNALPIPNQPDFTITKVVNKIDDKGTAGPVATLNGGGTVHYFYTITNTGNVTLRLASAVDDKLGALSFSKQNLRPGESSLAHATKFFDPPALTTTEINTVAVYMVHGTDELPAKQATATVVNLPSPTFAVTKKVSTINNPALGQSTATLFNGGTVYYFYTVTNTSSVTISLAATTDDRLGQLIFTPTTLQPGQTATATASKQFPSLPIGGSSRFETNTVSVTIAHERLTYGPQTATATVTNLAPESEPAFSLRKLVSTVNDRAEGKPTAAIVGGGTVYYFYTVTNTGNVPLTLKSATDDRLGALSFTPTTILPGGTSLATASKTFAALAPDGALQSETNTATVTAGYRDASLTQSAQATVTNHPVGASPNFAVSKVVSTTNNISTGHASVTLTGSGGTVYYFYTITNTGNVPLTVVGAKDDKLGGLTFTPTTIPVGATATATSTKNFPASTVGISETNTLTVTTRYGTTTLSPKSASASVTQTALPHGSVEVRVLDGSPRNNGLPVPIKGAQVILDGGKTGVTDASGQVHFPDLSFGTYVALAASHDPQRPASSEEKFGTGNTTINQSSLDGVITIVLSWEDPKPQLAISVCPTFAAVGGTITATGPNGATRIVSHAGPNGTYQVGDLAPGTWTILQTAAGLTTPAAQTITIRDDETVPNNRYTMDLSTICPATTGSVTGRICSPPQPGATISALGPNGNNAETTVPSDGILGQRRSFTLRNLIAGTWTLLLKVPGKPETSQPVTVIAGRTVTAPDFGLACTGEQAGPGVSQIIGLLMVVCGLLLRWRLRTRQR